MPAQRNDPIVRQMLDVSIHVTAPHDYPDAAKVINRLVQENEAPPACIVKTVAACTAAGNI